MKAYRPGNWEFKKLAEYLGNHGPVVQFKYRQDIQQPADPQQAPAHKWDQAEGHGDGNHGHAGHGDGNVIAISNHRWQWNRKMEVEVEETRKQFYKLESKAKKTKEGAKEARQVAGDAVEKVKELQGMCEELAENIVRGHLKADQNMQAGRMAIAKLQTRMTALSEEHLKVQQLQTQIAISGSSSSSGCFSLMQKVASGFAPSSSEPLGDSHLANKPLLVPPAQTT